MVYETIVGQVVDGSWKSSDIWWGLKEGLVELAPISSKVPAETVALVESERTRIVDGSWDVFSGPIKNQKGEVVVKEGEKMTDGDMLGMNWFVEGVEGEIPQ
jgi:basic membrane protein A